MLDHPLALVLADAADHAGGLFAGGSDTHPDGSVSLTLDTQSFLIVVAASALASGLAVLVGRRLAVPVVVLELLLGIVVGPDVLDIVQPDDFILFFGNLGLGMLFFFAGYEIDFARIRGAPLKLACLGWAISLVLAYSIGGLLALAGVVVSLLFTGSALVTTALGTLIPIMGDAGVLRERFGTFALAAGAVGEFGPIMLVTLLLSSTRPASTAAILVVFVLLAVATALIGVRFVHRGWDVVERNLEGSGQLAVRVWVLVTFALVALAATLGLDLLLGGFAAGIATRVALGEREVHWFESKLTAVGYGFFIPFFFVTSGVKFDLVALGNLSALAKLPLFLVLFLIVRGVPVLLLYRSVLDVRDRLALALFAATELPLVVALTTLALEDGHMRSSTAAALVGAAIISTACFPLLGLRLRDRPTYRVGGGWWTRRGSSSRSAAKAGPSASASEAKTGSSAA
jgi:Kef-type K+ transport system membrane component KefB